jgi:hypothetical protein
LGMQQDVAFDKASGLRLNSDMREFA